MNALRTLALGLLFCAPLRAHDFAADLGGFREAPLLHATLTTLASSSMDIDELAMAPGGEWVVVAGAALAQSQGFPSAALARIQEALTRGRRVDAVAVAPAGGWMVIADDLYWSGGRLKDAPLLERLVQDRVNSGQRIRDLAFDADDDGWLLVSDFDAVTHNLSGSVLAAVAEVEPTGRMLHQGCIAANGRWVVLAGDWHAGDRLPRSLRRAIGGFQREEKTMDRMLLGPAGSWILYSHGSFQPRTRMEQIEYGLVKVGTRAGPEDRADAMNLGLGSYNPKVDTSNIWERMQDLDIPGLSIAIIDNSQVAWARGYGVRKKGTQEFITTTTPFDAASLSKFVSAMGMLTLVDDPNLPVNLNTTLESVALSGPPGNTLETWEVVGKGYRFDALPWDQMTLRRLLSHTASLQPTSGSKSYDPSEPIPNTWQMLLGADWDAGNSKWVYGGSKMVWYDSQIWSGNNPPDFNIYGVGDVYAYSGGGYLAAAAMAEVLTGQGFPTLMQQRVLTPLGMSHSTFVQPLSQAWDDAAAWPHQENGKAAPYRKVYPWAPTGGLYCSASDLAQPIRTLIGMGKAPNGQQLLKLFTAQAMMVHQAPNDGLNNPPVKIPWYGFGLGLSANWVGSANDEWFSHSGSHTDATRTLMAGSPGRREGIVLMVNKGGDDAAALLSELYSSFKAAYGWN